MLGSLHFVGRSHPASFAKWGRVQTVRDTTGGLRKKKTFSSFTVGMHAILNPTFFLLASRYCDNF